MNISTFKITFINEGENGSCRFYDEWKNLYVDNSYMGNYSEGDRVRVGWAYFGGEIRNTLWVDRIA